MRDKRQKFIELAEARVTRALREIRLIGNLSNRNAYAFTEEDVRQMFRALHKELEIAKARFAEQSALKDSGFRLER